MLSRHHPRLPRILAGSAILLLASSAAGATAPPPLPAQIPSAERARLQSLAESASVSAYAAGQPFLVRRDVFEFLLDHPELATHVTGALRLARYRVWRDSDGGLWLDDGWGAVGQFRVVYSAPGMRIVYARGEYQSGFLPSIRGQAVAVLEYDVTPAGAQHSLIAPVVRGFVKVDSGVLDLAGRLVGVVATAKAEKEAQRLVKIFVRVSRALDDNPAHVHALVRQRPGVPPRDVEELRRLLRLP